MLCKRWLISGALFLLGAALILSTVLIDVRIMHAQRAQSLQAMDVRRGDPVGVVYFRCRLNSARTQCSRSGVTYFVHNGISLGNFSSGDPVVRIGHVGNWLRGQETLNICGASLAADVVRAGSPQEPCSGSTAPGDPVWRPWARVRTISYPPQRTGEPMAFVLNLDFEHPHNGAFRDFVLVNSNGVPIGPRVTTVNAAIALLNAHPSSQSILRYFHATNLSGHPQREANSPGAFSVEPATAGPGFIDLIHLHT